MAAGHNAGNDPGVNFYNIDFVNLLRENASAEALHLALKRKGMVQLVETTKGSLWVIVGGYALSTWPASKTFLHLAATMGCAEIVRSLAEHYECDVNVPSKDGGTALHLAAYYGHAEVVAILLELNADKQIKNSQGETALDSAKEGKEAHSNKPLKFFPRVNQTERFNFSERPGWPGWDIVIDRLQPDQ
eukprot:CAMPEP_0173083540 /NCGR_PEP_ID=MMETSP1102-20130122/19564_1 /TAXON_ID=49646 /ORGANISM="Geminigera sp., Strain Caron Lab Isolate" /LENGTH=188 /DNA_ID=CAMNT_0013960601 /DNA_START=54 /DNA_END=620 /DNA_ORIENTATION=-